MNKLGFSEENVFFLVFSMLISIKRIRKINEIINAVFDKRIFEMKK